MSFGSASLVNPYCLELVVPRVLSSNVHRAGRQQNLSGAASSDQNTLVCRRLLESKPGTAAMTKVPLVRFLQTGLALRSCGVPRVFGFCRLRQPWIQKAVAYQGYFGDCWRLERTGVTLVTKYPDTPQLCPKTKVGPGTAQPPRIQQPNTPSFPNPSLAQPTVTAFWNPSVVR